MKVKLDENLPAALVDALGNLGHDVDTVAQQRLAGRPDSAIWDAAQREARFLITQDMDFSDARRFAPSTHHGLLLVRLTQPGRLALLRRIGSLVEGEDLEQWRSCFVVATEHKLRVRRPIPHASST